MKPPPFEYYRPKDVGDALRVLAEHGEGGKVLAGGQSLVPLMSMRLAAPEHLVDISRLPELGVVRAGHDGVRVGAAVRQATLERDDAAFAAQPLLRQALGHVAHPTIRNRGTVVGSLAHGDPAAELTAVLALLGGTVTLRGPAGERTVPAGEFFVGPLESAVAPGELATEAFFPALPPRSGTAWAEVSRRNGDYAICGVGAVATLDGDRRVDSATVSLISVGPTPVVVDLTAELGGRPADAVDLDAAGRAVGAAVEPEGDIHASAEYRRHLSEVLTARALRTAITRALEGAA